MNGWQYVGRVLDIRRWWSLVLIVATIGQVGVLFDSDSWLAWRVASVPMICWYVNEMFRRMDGGRRYHVNEDISA